MVAGGLRLVGREHVAAGVAQRGREVVEGGDDLAVAVVPGVLQHEERATARPLPALSQLVDLVVELGTHPVEVGPGGPDQVGTAAEGPDAHPHLVRHRCLLSRDARPGCPCPIRRRRRGVTAVGVFHSPPSDGRGTSLRRPSVGPVSTPAALPPARVVVDPPPTLEADEGAAGVLTSAVPMLGSLGSVALVATMATQSGGSGQRSMLAAGAFLVGTLALVLVQLDRVRVRRTRRRAVARRAYLRHLADVRGQLRAAADQQRARLRHHHPAPRALPRVVAGGRAWERGHDHPEALVVRYALGDGSAVATPGQPAPSGTGEPDPAALDALLRLLAAHARVPGLPLTLDLRTDHRVVVEGDREAARSLARSLVAQATAFHPPERLAVAVVTGPEATGWDWLKWLPHAIDRPAPDAHLLLVVDGGPADPPSHQGGVTVLHLASGGAVGDVRLRLGSDRSVTTTRGHGTPVTGTADECDAATAEVLARRLLPLRSDPGPPGRGAPDVSTLLGLPHPPVPDPLRAWLPRPEHLLLRAVVGTTDAGAPLHLDLKEAARGGVGPHGLVVGATGSGKSELLRTLVLGLVLGHPPDLLNLVLVDFKGGATFAGLEPLPHVAAAVTNLADDLALVDRMQDALAGELLRRQELLRSAGVASVREHAVARAGGVDLPPLPTLLVVVDEFAEMLVARPELLDVFTAIGRLGRSLGVHLLLATQRLEEGRLRGLESHLSYRIGLRTFSGAESRAVLGVPDAAELPPVPGTGLLRTGPGDPVRFRAAHVSGPATATVPPAIRPFGPGDRPAAPSTPRPDAGRDSRSVLDQVVAGLAGHGAPARPVWLPPLETPDTLGDLLGPVRREPRLGLVAAARRPDPLRVPVGVVDRPHEQRRDPLVVDLDGAGGHVAIVGAPRSGRTTVLQTVVAALALTHTPREAQVLVVDLAGGGLAPLAGLPHVAAVATRGEPEVVRRVVSHLADLVDRRESWWRDHGVTDVGSYRRRLRAGEPGDGSGEVFLVVDGWADLRADHADLEPVLHRVASRGLALGVHLVVAAGRWGDLRPATRDLFGTRCELRLGDPLDSEIDRRAARRVPIDRPGRGLTGSGHHLLTALPRLDGDADPATAAAGLTELVDRVAAAWPGQPVPQVGRLPTEVRLEDLRTVAGEVDCLLLGVDHRRAIGLDPGSEPHLVVFGDRGSGRTTALRTLAAEVVRTRSPAQAQLVVVDPRRGLLDAAPPDHLLGHHASAATAEPALRQLADHLRGRLPGPSVTAAQLRDRSWWSGAEVHVVVDDHELLVTDGRSPLAPLLPLLPHAADIGLRVTVARRTAGAARALHEPDLRALRELAAPTLLLPGSPDEGPLVGRWVARPGPPGRGRLVSSGGEVTELQVARAAPAGAP